LINKKTFFLKEDKTNKNLYKKKPSKINHIKPLSRKATKKSSKTFIQRRKNKQKPLLKKGNVTLIKEGKKKLLSKDLHQRKVNHIKTFIKKR